jgi:hypothetical protein
MEVSGEFHVPAALLLKKIYPVGPRARLDAMEKRKIFILDGSRTPVLRLPKHSLAATQTAVQTPARDVNFVIKENSVAVVRKRTIPKRVITACRRS